MKKTVSAPEEIQIKYERPSEKEHLFAVVDVLETLSKDPYVVHVKLEVVGGDEEGRSILNRVTLSTEDRGWFATQLFLKAIGLQYHGDNFEVDTDKWIGKQFYATVIHRDKYANIDKYNFDKPAAMNEIEW